MCRISRATKPRYSSLFCALWKTWLSISCPFRLEFRPVLCMQSLLVKLKVFISKCRSKNQTQSNSHFVDHTVAKTWPSPGFVGHVAATGFAFFRKQLVFLSWKSVANGNARCWRRRQPARANIWFWVLVLHWNAPVCAFWFDARVVLEWFTVSK